MAIGWNFPNSNYGNVSGIGDAGIETFKGSLYRSLAREICQNSLDARLDDSRPVEVEFSLFDVSRDNIPGFSQLEETFRKCGLFWKRENNKKIVDFFTKANQVAGYTSFPILRISDFNTTGLTGSNKKYNSPWQNLVKASGVSDKAGSAGGSFGIGKSAPYACSNFRTVFYSTLDKDNLKAYQGVARLVSFPENDSDDSLTSGIGYFGKKERNEAVPECLTLSNDYRRIASGTDIFIIAFDKQPGWKEEVVKAILEDFLVAVHNNDLIVNVDGLKISSDTLESVVTSFKDFMQSAYGYYLALTKPSHERNYDFLGMGNVNLRFLLEQNLQRRVMVCRKNGMKIFDQKNISGSIDFAGVCILEDNRVNEYFREMENPQHNAWEPDRHSNKKEAKKNVKIFRDTVRSIIVEEGTKVALEETDAEGVGEYIADLDENESKNQDFSEQITDKIHEIELTVLPPKSGQKGFEKSVGEGTTFEESAGEFVDYTGGEGGRKDVHDDKPNKTHEGPSFGRNDGPGQGSGGEGDSEPLRETGVQNEEASQIMKSAFSVKMMSVRLLSLNASNKEYRLIFTPEKVNGDAFLQLKLSGEQPGRMPLKIVSAIDEARNISLKCKEDLIFIDNIIPKQKYKVKFTIDYNEKCSMEVNLYGYHGKRTTNGNLLSSIRGIIDKIRK